MDDECIHGLGPVTACTICNGREAKDRAFADAISHRFRARFDGECAKCDGAIFVGDMMAATNGGRYLCASCAA